MKHKYPDMPECELVWFKGFWRLEYVQQGVRVATCIKEKEREDAIKEVIRQGFTKINIWEILDGHHYNRGTVRIPKQTLSKAGA